MLAERHIPEAANGGEDREAARLAALERYDVLDTPSEEAFDRISRLVRSVLGVPMSVVSLIDAHRQWFKAAEGIDATELPLEDTFCRNIIRDGGQLIINDTHADARFVDNVLVTGEPHIRSYAGVPLQTADGHTIGTLCAVDRNLHSFSENEVQILKDLAQIAVNQLELRALAATDALTGLPSRRGFKDAAAREVNLAVRHGHDLSAIAIDLDHFKVVNDTYGHAAGDEVLKAVAETLRQGVRRTDLTGRLGGEEFAVVLPHTSLRQAAEVAEKLRAAVSRLRFEFGGKKVGVTASFGISQLDRAIGTLDTLLADADAALYKAKAGGRDRSVMHQSDEAIQRSTRRRVLKAGQIILNARHSTIDCTIRSLSDDGAGIDVSNTGSVPERFTLSIPSDRFETRCKVITQTEKHLEVEFQ